MKYKDIRLHLSSQRLNRYFVAAGHSAPKAVRLYKANLRLAQSFHPIIGTLEIVLRNSLNTILTSHFSDPDWIINQKSGFMTDPSLTYIHKRTSRRKINNYIKQQVEKAEKRINKTGAVPTSGKIISEQTFGFWTSYFEVHHYRLLLGRPIQIFKHLPSGFGRKEVFDELEEVRLFRNRINHNEPICFNGTTIDLSLAEATYQSINDLFNWIDPRLTGWITDLDSIPTRLKHLKTY